MAATPVGRLFGSDETLSRLQDHAARLIRLQRTVEGVLPKAMRHAVAVANFQDGTLTLHASNPSVASRLNMSLDSLIEELQAKGQAVLAVKVKVRAIQNAASAQTTTTPNRRMGDQGRAAFDALRQKVDADTPLGAAIKRILKDSK